MSHQTGIKPNEELGKVFSKAKDGKFRLVKVSIQNEQLSCAATADAKKDWQRDYDKLIAPVLEENVPCYVLYRLDEKTSLGYAWLLLSWVPDTASIREKMVYASTKATLKTEFGSAHITEELHATTLDETTLDGYHRHKKAFSAPAPLTTREEEMAEIRKTEVRTEVSMNTPRKTLDEINGPVTEDVQTAVEDMLRGNYDYLQFHIDLIEERVHLSHAAKVNVKDLPKQVPTDQARYHLYLFKHTHEGDYQESYIFIYSMPGYVCPVRERMMYSTCMRHFTTQLQGLGVDIVKRLEIENGSELTEQFLQDELHPKKILNQPAFAKPKGPPNRGAKRLTRPTTEAS